MCTQPLHCSPVDRCMRMPTIDLMHTQSDGGNRTIEASWALALPSVLKDFCGSTERFQPERARCPRSGGLLRRQPALEGVDGS